MHRCILVSKSYYWELMTFGAELIVDPPACRAGECWQEKGETQKGARSLEGQVVRPRERYL